MGPEKRRLIIKLDEELKKAASSTLDSERQLEILNVRVMLRLKAFEFETPETASIFTELISTIEQNVLLPMQRINLNSKSAETIREKRSITARYRIVMSHLYLLTRAYSLLGMTDRCEELYILRMDLLAAEARIAGKQITYRGFQFVRMMSIYGTSFSRLFYFIFISLVGFAALYWISDYFAPLDQRMISQDLSALGEYYFGALVTFTSLGIDGSPTTPFQQIVVSLDSLYGILALGMLFNVISTKLSMNNG